MQIKEKIKKIIPKQWLSGYHLVLARVAAWLYNRPSEKLVVIGVTGTNGKTATTNFISQYLECLGFKTGLASTINFKVAEKTWLNDKKMTMLGRLQTQKLLAQMVRVGCQYAVIETSSQGIDQHRHKGINYDVVVFTNLTPEHIEAHGGWENYRAAKEKLFYHLSNSSRKKIGQKTIDKIIITNADDEETKRLREIKSDKTITYGFVKQADLFGEGLKQEQDSVVFYLNKQKIENKLFGRFNGYNLLAALATASALGLDLKKAVNCQIKALPGRQEWIECGQDFRVMVDYAPEPESLKQLYQNIKEVSYNKLIHVLGSCGGGRDKARQPILGKMAGETADIIIVTNEDPYDDDPQEIIDNVASGAVAAGKREGQTLYKILDRKEAIKKALEIAQTNDLLLITGKGSEQYICVADGKKIPHDDREVVKEFLK